jgi:two-component system chemotaxis response regulator CheB
VSVNLLIIDDSAVARQSLTSLFALKDFEVETAIDAVFALSKMERHWPDVVVLDLELPRLDGLGFLKQVMANRPTPVVVCSGLTERGAQASMAALAAGAVAVFPKTALRVGSDGGAELVRLVRAAAGSKVASPAVLAAPVQPHHPVPRGAARPGARVVDVVAIGASTGGPQSLEVVLSALGAGCPPLVIVQHMPEKFTRAFADRLDGLSDLEVREAQGGEVLKPGLAFIAPGGRHLQVRRANGELVTEVLDAPPVNRHCPSVDVLFRSLAKLAGVKVAGLVMTGMGDDGARGLLELKNAGAATFAQDEATSVVYGMPKEAARLGAAEAVVPLPQLASVIMGFARA